MLSDTIALLHLFQINNIYIDKNSIRFDFFQTIKIQ